MKHLRYQKSSQPVSRLAAAFLAITLIASACGDDDGEEVREDAGVTEIDDDGSDGGSVSGSSSGSASGSASSSAPADEEPSGSASAPAADSGEEMEATAADGGYAYASDVSSHRLVVQDICEINELLGADTIDFDQIATIYRDGKNSVKGDGSIRTIGGFASRDDKKHGLDVYYGTPTPLDDFITAALDGTGMFADMSDAVRKQGVQKGIQNQTMVAWVTHEILSSLAKAGEGNFDPAEGAPHNWDEGWAFFHGSAPGCAPYGTGDKRADNFGTLAEDGETALANEAIVAAMNDGRDALIAGDFAGAQNAALAFQRNVTITYAQATIRYAAKITGDVEAGDSAEAKVHQAEGLSFWRVLEPNAAAAGADVDAINALYDLANEPGANGGEAEVRSALEPLFAQMGISAEDIGELG